MISVRYFAGAAEAAGTDSEMVPAGSAGELRTMLSTRHGPDLERVLALCSLLADGVRIGSDTAVLAPGTTVDVLPPFAGG